MNPSDATLVKWREWSDEAFADAVREDKPILLDIGAVWCHWCHVMDHGIAGDRVHTGTYSNPELSAYINTNYIPIKVDNDKRPDINARYNMGGWPTTAFLTPYGDPLYGETYITPSRMSQLLPEISNYYKTNKDDIAKRIAAHESGFEPANVAPDIENAHSSTGEVLDWIDDQIIRSFDDVYAGFGTQPKFPHIEALEYALRRSVQSGNPALRQIFIASMQAMASGGMYDQFAGGFFRYSTTRDWSIPHYEKMLEDNAQLSRLAFLGARLLGDDHLAEIGRDVHNWLTTTMLIQDLGVFCGSQDADKEEEYYGRPLTERENMLTPYIDRTAYLSWNAVMVSSLCERYRSDLDQNSLDLAINCYEFIKDRIWPCHYFDVQTASGPEFLLTDAVALSNAAMDLAEATGRSQYNRDASNILNTILECLEDKKSGGYHDSPIQASAHGHLSKPVKELASSTACVSSLLRHYALSDTSEFLQSAKRTLEHFEVKFRTQGLFASAYGLAHLRLLDPVHIVLVGASNTPDLINYKRSLWNLSLPNEVFFEVFEPNESEQFIGGMNNNVRSYLCIGNVCKSCESLDQLIDSIQRT